MKIKLETTEVRPDLVAVVQGDSNIWMKMPNGEVIFLGPDGLEEPYTDDLSDILNGAPELRKPVYAGEPITIRLVV